MELEEATTSFLALDLMKSQTLYIHPAKHLNTYFSLKGKMQSSRSINIFRITQVQLWTFSALQHPTLMLYK